MNTNVVLCNTGSRLGREVMLKALKTYEVLTNRLLIYKWALCQVSFDNLKIIGVLKTLYAGTIPNKNKY
jgi:hypothetical protein